MGQALAGDGGRALADDLHAVDAAVAQALAHRLRQRAVRQLDVHRPVGLEELAAERLAERPGRVRDLLEQVVREVAAVDVAGRDLGQVQVALGDRQFGAVVGPAADALDRAGLRGVEHHDLAPAARGVVGVGRGLAVHPQEVGGLLDHAVRLRGDDERVLGHADVERLAAAAQRQHELLGVGRAGRGDGHGALEPDHGLAERLVDRQALGELAGQQGRDDLGVGGDLGRDLEPVRRDQVGVVVDVAVEHGGGQRHAGAVQLLGGLRVRVRLGDDADRRPAGVAQDQSLDVVGAQRQVQQLVLGHGGTQGGGVVAQLADLGGRLVDDQQHAVDEPDRARRERAVVPLGERTAEDRVVGRDAVAGELHLDAGRVAATDLEAVHRRQGLVEAEQHGEARGTGARRGQRRDLVGGTHAVAGHGPHGVLHTDERGVDGLEVRAAEPGVAGVEGSLDALGGGGHLGDLGGDPADGGGVRGQREDAGDAPEVAVDALEQVGGRGELFGPGRRHVGEQAVGGHET